MKKLFLLTFGISLFAITFFWSACKKTDGTDWNDEEHTAYNHVINLQDEVSAKLNDWFSSLDSLEAIQMAQQEFANDPNVSSVTVGSQGIMVQYANGMRGGLFLNPDRGEDIEGKSSFMKRNFDAHSDNNLKAIVNQKKMLFLDPTVSQFPNAHEKEVSNDVPNLDRIGTGFYTYNGTNLDEFANLAGNGIINISSHGAAWPDQNNITEVYLLTGVTENKANSDEYWDEIADGKIPIIMADEDNKYWISPEFITEHNDFSQDTILFYGCFCYSNLGGWPGIVESFAEGAYVGFDWIVEVRWASYWSTDLIRQMSDTSRTDPVSIGTWMSDPDIEHSYYDNTHHRTVSIHYTGDGTLKLWNKTQVDLIPQSDDGTPVSNPGEAGVAYPFKCQVIGGGPELEYVWDIGDNSSPVSTTENEVDITWNNNGTYVFTVTVNNKTTGEKIGEDAVNVTIGSSSLTWNAVKFKLRHVTANYKHLVLPAGTITYFDSGLEWTFDNHLHPGIYQNGSFTATWDFNDEIWENKGSVILSIDEQTKKVTGGTIHAEYINMSNPDNRYYVIDFNIQDIDAKNWDLDHGSFLLEKDEVCNTSYLNNLSYEDSQTSGPGILINTMQYIICDDYSYFSLDFSTE